MKKVKVKSVKWWASLHNGEIDRVAPTAAYLPILEPKIPVLIVPIYKKSKKK